MGVFVKKRELTQSIYRINRVNNSHNPQIVDQYNKPY